MLLSPKSLDFWGYIFKIWPQETLQKKGTSEYRILFLHHSTGDEILNGGKKPIRFIGRFFKQETSVSKWFRKYNKSHATNYRFDHQYFPKNKPYGWRNYPSDYYNIWVKHAGNIPFMTEPTLEILTKKYSLIIFKHCYPVSDIMEDIGQPSIDSSEKRLENYKLQYIALKQKMLEFPNTKFILWTGAAQVEKNSTIEKAQRAKTFFDWVRTEWDTPTDNIFIWDFYHLETEGTLFLKLEFARSPNDSHPNGSFAKKASELFCKRIIEVIEQAK